MEAPNRHLQENWSASEPRRSPLADILFIAAIAMAVFAGLALGTLY